MALCSWWYTDLPVWEQSCLEVEILELGVERINGRGNVVHDGISVLQRSQGSSMGGTWVERPENIVMNWSEWQRGCRNHRRRQRQLGQQRLQQRQLQLQHLHQHLQQRGLEPDALQLLGEPQREQCLVSLPLEALSLLVGAPEVSALQGMLDQD